MTTLGLFFTAGVSLEEWVKTGLFWREKQIYEKHLEEKVVDKIIWFTYGSKDKKIANKLKKENKLNKKIEVVEKPKIFIGIIGSGIYSLILPWIKKKECKKCNIYKTNQMMGVWSAVLAKKKYHKKIIIRTGYGLHTLYTNQNKRTAKIINMIEKWAYKNSDYAITTSKEEYEKIKRKRKVEKVALITNFVDTELFKPTKNKNKDLIFVGRIDSIKNPELLINTIKETNYSLDIYGQGPLKKKLEEKIKKEKIKKIRFKGKVSNKKLAEIIPKYKIYIQLSKREGMPKTIIEAMSCGLPIIGTNVEGIKEIVNSKNGILCKEDKNEIKTTIDELMKNNLKRKQKGKESRKQAEKNHSLNKIQKEEEKIIKELLK